MGRVYPRPASPSAMLPESGYETLRRVERTITPGDLISIGKPESTGGNEPELFEATVDRLFLTYLGDPELHKMYLASQRSHFELTSVLPLAVLLSAAVITRFNLQNIGSSYPLFSVAWGAMITGSVLFIPYMMARIVTQYTPVKTRSQFPYRMSKIWLEWCYRCSIEDVIGILVELICGFCLLARVYAGQCKDVDDLWVTQTCNPFEEVGSIPNDQVILLYAIPLMAQCMFRGISIYALAACSVCSLVFTLLASIHVGGFMDIWTIMYSVIFIIIMYAVDRLMRVTFVRGRAMLAAVRLSNQHELDMREIVAENMRMLKEKEMSQLHSLMGNVAHDLKTPLHSIEADLDVLRTLISKIPKSVIETAKAEIERGNRRDIDPDYIFENLTATCNFMVMSINRSQDYMKASNNIALVPMMETFAIVPSLEMAVTCVSTQSARKIVVHPPDTDICSHIISDKHWLRENALCLLSNAVKYSDDGAVDVRIQLIDISSKDTPQGQDKTATDFYLATQRKSVQTQRNSIISDCDVIPFSSLRFSAKEVEHSAGEDDVDSPEQEYMILVTVEDCGIGITDEARKDLFQPFKQAQKMAGGTGLGLYSLSKRVEALGGKCGAEARSDGKEGSLFWFTFPYRPDETATLDAHADTAPGTALNTISETASTEVSPRQSGEYSSPLLLPHMPSRQSILVIDDSLSILKVTARLLELKGHKVDTAPNGSVGLKMLKLAHENKKYDMVLTDLQMPVMDGMEAIKRFRKFEEQETIKCTLNSDDSMMPSNTRLLVVGMSANSDSQSRQEALDSGMDHFITKPFSYADFCFTTSGTTKSFDIF